MLLLLRRELTPSKENRATASDGPPIKSWVRGLGTADVAHGVFPITDSQENPGDVQGCFLLRLATVKGG